MIEIRVTAETPAEAAETVRRLNELRIAAHVADDDGQKRHLYAVPTGGEAS